MKKYEKQNIEEVQDLIKIAKEICDLENEDNTFCKIQRKRNKNFSLQNTFGIWFRGHSDVDYCLEPSIFRKKDSHNIYDENSIFVHAKLRLANYRKTCVDDFDWLCLMQHYEVPTRILDWSESAIIALYFAVREDDKKEKDGELIVLNARELNCYVGNDCCCYFSGCNESGHEFGSILTPDNISVIVLSTMAKCRDMDKLVFELNIKGINEERLKSQICRCTKKTKCKECKKSNETCFNNFSMPVAVFPNRFNQRMFFQSSVFTIHGGKIYSPEYQKYLEKEPEKKGVCLPKRKSIEYIDEEKNILKYYKIPKGRKKKIKGELFTLGIHEGSLFPEIDCQAKYFKEQWLPI